MTKQDRRKAHRISFESTIIIRSRDDNAVTGKVDTRDISLSGLYLKTWQRIPLETVCKVEIELTGSTSKLRFAVDGIISRHDDDGMGIAFLKLSPDNFLHISNLIKLHTKEESKA